MYVDCLHPPRTYWSVFLPTCPRKDQSSEGAGSIQAHTEGMNMAIAWQFQHFYWITHPFEFFLLDDKTPSRNSFGVQVLRKSGCCSNSIAIGRFEGSFWRHIDTKCFNSLDHRCGCCKGGGGWVVMSISALLGGSLMYGGCKSQHSINMMPRDHKSTSLPYSSPSIISGAIQ